MTTRRSLAYLTVPVVLLAGALAGCGSAPAVATPTTIAVQTPAQSLPTAVPTEQTNLPQPQSTSPAAPVQTTAPQLTPGTPGATPAAGTPTP